MQFPVTALFAGIAVRRVGWMPGATIRLSVVGEVDGKPVKTITLTTDDLNANDWEIHVPKPGES